MIMKVDTHEESIAKEVIDDIFCHVEEYIEELIHWSLDGRNLNENDCINISCLENKIYKELVVKLNEET